MLNFDEQTGIGVLMIVWSFLLRRALLPYVKHTITIISNNDTVSIATYHTLHSNSAFITNAILLRHNYNCSNTLTLNRVTIIFIFMLINRPSPTHFDIEFIENQVKSWYVRFSSMLHTLSYLAADYNTLSLLTNKTWILNMNIVSPDLLIPSYLRTYY